MRKGSISVLGMWLGVMLVGSPLIGQLSSEVESSSTWMDSSLIDLSGGYTNNTTLKYIGKDGYVELTNVEKCTWTIKPPPDKRISHMMAPVFNTSIIVLFGGWSIHYRERFSDTWLYNTSNGSWAHTLPVEAPPMGREESGMAMISGTDKVMLFGGGPQSLNDTWIYDLSDNNWKNQYIFNAPASRNSHAMAPVYNDDKVVLFGGVSPSRLYNDTWIFDQSDKTWTNVSPANSPPGRTQHTMAALTNDDKIVLFGGSPLSNDTWVYDVSDNNWTNMMPSVSPCARSGHSSASIFNNDKVVLFGGGYGDTWIYDLGDNRWTELTGISGPSANRDSAMVTINNDDRIMLFGGDYGSTEYCQTWVYDLSDNRWIGDTPLNPWYCWGSAMATICNSDKILLFGGTSWKNWDDTWVYDLSEARWTEMDPSLSPSPRYYHAMASVYNDDKVVLFGGYPSNKETWVYDLSDNRWTQKSPSTAPSARYNHQMAGLYNDDKVVLFGGDAGSYSNETWVYDLSDDTWSSKTSVKIPPGRAQHAMAALSNDDKIVMFGGTNGTIFGDTWVYDYSDNDWIYKSSLAPPPAIRLHTMATIYGDDKVILYGGINSAFSPETFYYDLSNDAWVNKNTKPKPDPRAEHAMAVFNGTDQVLLFGGRQDYTWYIETWLFDHCSYVSRGDYRSKAFDTGGSSDFYFIQWNAVVPADTGLRLQLRSGNNTYEMSAKNFSGPDGNATTYYNDSNTPIWKGHNGDRYVQYRVFMNTSWTNITPVLNDVFISYNRHPDAPVLLLPENDIWTNNSRPTFSWTFLDADSAIQAGFKWQTDNDSNFTHLDYNSGEVLSGVSVYSPNTSLLDGIWYWRIMTKDSEGAWSTANTGRVLKIDTVPPDAFVPRASNSSWTATSPAIYFNTTDNLSGLDRYEVKVDNNNSSKRTSPWILPEMIDGTHTVTVRAFDRAGNFRDGTIDVYIDKTPPNPFIPLVNAANWSNVSQPVLIFCATDNTSGIARYEIKVDNGIYNLQTSPYTIPALNDGLHTIFVRAYDRAGNWREALATAYIDTQLPSVAIEINNKSTTTNELTVRIKIIASDATSGLVDMAFSNDGVNYSGWMPFATEKNWSLVKGIGRKIVYFKARDKAGNVGDTVGGIYYDPVTCVTISPKSASLLGGETVQFSATGVDANGDVVDGLAFTWNVSGEIGTIDGNGLFMARKNGGPGTVSVQYGQKRATTVVFVNRLPLAGILSVSTRKVNVGENVTMTAIGTIEPDKDTVSFWFDYGDGNDSGWLEDINTIHAYLNPGTYQLRFKVKDAKGEESNWSLVAVLDVIMPGTVRSPTPSSQEQSTLLNALPVVTIAFVAITVFIYWRKKRKGIH
jgi:hypothetical protein